MDVCSEILKTRCRVAVLCGGAGSERAVSLVSGRSVADAVRNHGLPCDLMQLPGHELPAELDRGRHLVLPIIHGTYGEDGRLSADLDRGGFAYAGIHIHIMNLTGFLMMGLFGHLYFAEWSKFRRAVDGEDFPAAGQRLNRIRMIVATNLGLGWITIIVGATGRYWG